MATSVDGPSSATYFHETADPPEEREGAELPPSPPPGVPASDDPGRKPAPRSSGAH
jgi:hypothetical protein